MPTLTPSAPWSTSAFAPVGGRDVAADHLHLRVALLHPLRRGRARPANGRATCRRRSRRRRPRPALRRAPRCRSPMPTAAPTRKRPSSSLQAFGCSVAFRMSLTVIRPRSSHVVVDRRARARGGGGASAPSRVSRSVPSGTVTSLSPGVMMSRHRLVEVRLEAQVAVGDDADDALALDDRAVRRSGAAASARAPRAPTSSAGS